MSSFFIPVVLLFAYLSRIFCQDAEVDNNCDDVDICECLAEACNGYVWSSRRNRCKKDPENPESMFDEEALQENGCKAVLGPDETDALIKLYEGLNGPSWLHQWNFSTNGCELKGVLCNKDGQLVELDLTSNNIQGSLPSEIGMLEHVVDLNFEDNFLEGVVPSEIGNLANLTTLNLQHNYITALPAEIEKLESLIELKINDNSLEGGLPSEIGNLNNLEILHASACNLKGTIPIEYCNMSSLVELRLHRNSLTGTIPQELGNLTTLEQLLLGENSFSGTLPSSIGDLYNIKSLRLQSNAFSGTIPPSFGELVSLKTLDVTRNQISGDLPSFEGAHFIEELLLSRNKLTGTIPENFVLAGQALQILILDNNKLVGSIPSVLGLVNDLDKLYLNNNHLNGTIPNTFGDRKNLVDLLLSTNKLTGTIPQKICDIRPLMALDLSNNMLTGSIPACDSWYSLVHFDVGFNNLDGTIPTELSSWISVGYLSLSHNNLMGEIPSDIGNLGQALEVDFNGNGLDGEIPRSFWKLADKLEYLDLKSNSFRGTIATEIGNMAGIKELSLEQNEFSGSIPTEIGRMESLQKLLLGNNNLTGSIPQEFYSLVELDTFDAQSNKLEGTISPEISNMGKLKDLNLGMNNFSGPIPAGLGELPELVEFNMRSNLFVGTIPSTLLASPNLDLLLLGGNPLDCPVSRYVDVRINDYNIYSLAGQCVGGERDIIVDVVQSLNADQWIVENDWKIENIHYCQFSGIGCETPTGPITSINVTNIGVTGRIPDTLQNLTTLKTLLLGSNPGLYCPVRDYTNWAETTDYEFYEKDFTNCFYCNALPPTTSNAQVATLNGETNSTSQRCSESEFVGTTCVLECLERFEPTSGVVQRECRDQNYEEFELKCSAVCEVSDLPNIESVNCGKKLKNGEKCEMQCEYGFIHSTDSGTLIRHCQDDGTLTEDPVCFDGLKQAAIITCVLLAAGLLVVVGCYFYFVQAYVIDMVKVVFAVFDFITSVMVVNYLVQEQPQPLVFTALFFLVFLVCFNICVILFCLHSNGFLRDWMQTHLMLSFLVLLLGCVSPFSLFRPWSSIIKQTTLDSKYQQTFTKKLSVTAAVSLMILAIPQFGIQMALVLRHNVALSHILCLSLFTCGLDIAFWILEKVLSGCIAVTELLNKNTRLQHHAKTGHIDDVIKLLESGADVDSVDRLGRSSLILGSRNGHTQVVEELIKKKAEIDLSDQKLRTPLMHASKKGNSAVVQILLNNSANIHTDDEDGNTALHIAAIHTQINVIEILNHYLPAYEAENKDGKTVFDLACENQQEPIRVLDSLSKYFCFSATKFVTFSELDNVKTLDSGAYGEVLSADLSLRETKDGHAKIPVVCKVSKGTAGINEWNELQVLQNLPNHPNVVGLIAMCAGFGDKPIKQTAMIIIFKEGGSLLHVLCKKRKMFSMTRMVFFGTEMARGVKHLHDHGYKHCDIAGRNFLLSADELDQETPEPKDQTIAITDFGLSRSIEVPHGKSTAFPFLWCPLEMFCFVSNESTDTYMLGCALYELSTHPYLKPFALPSRSLKEHKKNLRAGEKLSFPKYILKQLNEEWIQLLLWCTEQEPENRPNMAQLIQKLAELQINLRGKPNEEHFSALSPMLSVENASADYDSVGILESAITTIQTYETESEIETETDGQHESKEDDGNVTGEGNENKTPRAIVPIIENEENEDIAAPFPTAVEDQQAEYAIYGTDSSDFDDSSASPSLKKRTWTHEPERNENSDQVEERKEESKAP